MKNKVILAMGIGIAAAMVPAVAAFADESQLTDDEIKGIVADADGKDVVLDEKVDNTDYTNDNDTSDRIEVTQEAGAWDIVDQSTLQEGDAGLTDPTKVAEITITDHIADEVGQDVVDNQYTDPKYTLTDTTEEAVADKITEIEKDPNAKVVDQNTDQKTGDVTLDIETTRTDDEMKELVDKAIEDLGKDDYIVDETKDITTDNDGNITVIGHKDVNKTDAEMAADIEKAKDAIKKELAQYGEGEIDWKQTDPDPDTGDVTVTGTIKIPKDVQELVDALLLDLGEEYTFVSAEPDPENEDVLVITVSHEVGRLDADIQKDIADAKDTLEKGKKDGEKLTIDDSKKTADGKKQIITGTYYDERLDELSGIGGDCDNLQDNQGDVEGKVGYRHETGNGQQNPDFDKKFWNGVIDDVIANGANNGVDVFVYDGTDAEGLIKLIKEVSEKNLDMSNVIIVAKNELSGNLVLPDLDGKSFGTLLLNPNDNDGITIDKDANGNLVSNHIHLKKGAKLTVGDMSDILKKATKRTETLYVDLTEQEKKQYKKDRYDKHSKSEDVKGKKTVDSEPIVINKIVKTQEIVKKQYSVDSSVTKVFYANLKAAPTPGPGPEPGPGPNPGPDPNPGPPTFTPTVAPLATPAANQGVLGARRAPAPTVDQGVLGKRRAPNTGDSMAIFGWIAGLMATLGGAGAASVALKKTKDKEEE